MSSEQQRPKRRVSYNQDAILCPACKKRIRLNNSGRMRVHIVGKMGSDRCKYSDCDLFGHKPVSPGHNVFSDIW